MRTLPILIVDDDPFWVDMLKKRITSAYPSDSFNFVFYTADNGAMGLQLFQELRKVGLKPEIILCDTNMPFIDGIHLWKALKSVSEKLPPFILFFSGLHSNPEINKSNILASGIQYVLTKDEASEELIPLLQKIV